VNNLKVVSLSYLCGNLYRELFINHLNSRGVQIADYLPTLLFLPKVIKDGNINILHLHTLHYFFPAGRYQIVRLIKFFIFIIQIILLRLMGVKIVWTVHEWADRWGNGKNVIPPSWAAIIGRLFHAAIAHSDTTKDEIVKAFRLENQDKVFVVLHGNYIGSYENTISQIEARKALGIPTDNLVFLLFGHIHRTKGFLEAIDAFKQLQENQISLLIAGYPAEEQIEELIRDKVEDNKDILFVPRKVPDEEIQIYMNACDCVLVPYKVFTTSGVTILSMSFGRACIAPRIGFFKDVLDDSGSFLYDSTHKDSLLQAMSCVIKKRESILDMGKHNLQLAEQWSWDYVAEETIKIYKRCLGY
jgi:glycosyltransferase involved in cell wall biosynthesis